ncbi:DUF4232 domain-containing protein [Streptomyces millisiae]|uniref:DUF4232 domain-containing protein n=1 Tax=Streptomyces millisiae TaxID=3075542 RepID=A0ABU2LKW0_9ACTN|nr:DUF4232 domain-containing protein [Streptomyces sp. DSM 44918]MDT0317898.1 DUF4232 domain-containing protein [Streptomyces sp. DSM 44918]
MNAFTLRRRTRTLVAAVAAVAALSLTACQDDELVGGGDAGQEESGSAAGQDGTSGGTTGGGSDQVGDGEGTEDGEDIVEGGGQGEDGEAGDELAVIPCADQNTQVTVSPVERPINHLLLTVTNTGDERCEAFSYPLLGFENSQSTLPFVEDSVPQAVVSLEPGDSAYAGVITSAADSAEGYTSTSLSLTFMDVNGNPVGELVDLALPGGEVFVGDAAAVTYWQTDMDTALMW